jgi:nitroreductase
MEHYDGIHQRYSSRAYKPQEVEQYKLDLILESARLAPTAANRQAIKIIIIKTANRQDELKEIYNRVWFTEAPCLVCVCSMPDKSWVRADQKNYSDVDAAIVMDHIIMTATSLGLGTCWVAAFDPLAAKRILNLDQDWEPVAFTPLGYSRDSLSRKVRKSLDELVVYR